MSSRIHSCTSCDGRCELKRAKAHWGVALCILEGSLAERETLRKAKLSLQPMSGEVSAVLKAYSVVSRLYRERLNELSRQAISDEGDRSHSSVRTSRTWTLDGNLVRGEPGIRNSGSLQPRTEPDAGTSRPVASSDTFEASARRSDLWRTIAKDYTAWLRITDQLRAVLVRTDSAPNVVVPPDQKKGFARLIRRDTSIRRTCIGSLIRIWGTTCGPMADGWCEFRYNEDETVEMVPPP